MKLSLLRVALVLLFGKFASANISECCKQGVGQGMKALTPEGTTCSEDKIDFAAVQNADRMLCSVIFKQCCTAAAEREVCTEGISRAMSRVQCTERSGPGGATQKTCCNCCKGGVQQALSNGPCNIKQDTQYCSDAFSACCKNPGLGPKVSTKAATTVAATTIAATSKAAGALSSSPAHVVTKATPKATTAATTKAPTTVDAAKGPTCMELQCSHACETMSENGSGRCVCKNGYELQADKQTCQDRNECIAQSGSVCDRTEVCLNTDGSYICLRSCPYGYRKIGQACVDVNECATGGKKCPTNFRCINTEGSYHCKRMTCSKGYALIEDQCYDINECDQDKNICGDGGRCYNQQGSYYCICSTGYTRNPFSGKCQDVDECTRGQDYCAHQCTNTKGSYTCKCPRGYTSVGRSCIDIDECSEKLATCPQGFSCFNNFGSYACIRHTCPSNFYIQPSRYECKLHCPGSDACSGILVQSVKWVAYRFRKTLARGNFHFTYFLRVNSYVPTTISFYFAEGNEDRGFFIQRTEREQVRITNVKQLTGPKEYNLRMHADIIYDGKPTSRFVYMFYIYLSEYDV